MWILEIFDRYTIYLYILHHPLARILLCAAAYPWTSDKIFEYSSRYFIENKLETIQRNHEWL